MNPWIKTAFASTAAIAILMAADVVTDYDKSVDFSRYKTYSWLKVRANSELWKDRIEADIDQELMSKGWQKVDTGGDAAVTAIGATRQQQQMQTYYDNFGGGWGWRGFGGMSSGRSVTSVDYIPVGNLTVDIFDAQSKKLIWRGGASKVLSNKPEKNEKNLKQTVKDLFKKFPPMPKG
ncbi:DUF4136 domain-containing protein, partial [Bryobacter aggregatus]|uniref:DUF4136 domain-containing protein n=1 Tax=Bryobacter aggregatus TaxID=360054 RepID=UPI0004E10AC2